ncbi:MAG: hypothetical protein FWG41_01505 [Methanomassiliicoccaceae archaeon]|nr:hypothetical protein [Methanomassiliicoccaceae archaeon]
MSGSSSKNSGSPQKGFFKRMLGQEPSRVVKQSEIKQRHPSFAVSNETAVTPGRTARPQEVIISPAVKQLNKDGYIVYNTQEKQDIYISIQPDMAFFDDEEPGMVRMAGGSFVGGNKHAAPVDITVKSEPEPEPMVYDQPADIFSNASRREVHEEIDFGEIIIKKNESFEEEIERTPVFFKPAFEEVYEPVTEEAFRMDMRPEMAKTSSEAVKIEEPKMPFSGYMEVHEYMVQETMPEMIKKEEPKASFSGYREVQEPMAQETMPEMVKKEEPKMSFSSYREMLEYKPPEPLEKAPVTDVPAGLYVDGRKPIDIAEADVEETSERSSFIGMRTEAETAVTSVSAPVAESAVPLLEAKDHLCLPFFGETEAVTDPSYETIVEEDSGTVAGEQAPIEVDDPVADIMKLTIPSLHMSEGLIAELAQDWEGAIPDDGLEAYDCKFEPMETPFKEEKAQCTVSFGFEGRESVINPNPSVNFRFS